jgi:hypothetical protein
VVDVSGKSLSSYGAGTLDMMSVRGESVWMIAVELALCGASSLYNAGLEARYPEITDRGRQMLECSAGKVDAERDDGTDREDDGDDSAVENV